MLFETLTSDSQDYLHKKLNLILSENFVKKIKSLSDKDLHKFKRTYENKIRKTIYENGFNTYHSDSQYTKSIYILETIKYEILQRSNNETKSI